MKVKFKLSKDILNLAAVLQAKPTDAASDAIVEASYYVNADAQHEAFDKAAIEFAKEWLQVEYV